MAKGKFSQNQNQKKPVKVAGPKAKTQGIDLLPTTKKMVPVTEMIKPIANLDEIVAAFEAYQNLKKRLQAEGDIVEIRGKECSTRTFDNKLCKFFGISVELIRAYKEEKVDEAGGKVIIWRVWAKAIAPSGQFRVAGAACSSDERSFAHTEHDVYAMAETRAKKRAIEELVGFGETLPVEDVEEKPGAAASKKDWGEIPVIKDQEPGPPPA